MIVSEDELGMIDRLRGEIMYSKEPTGENLFLAWGYPTVAYLVLEFLAVKLINEPWCQWIWVVIPLFGAPLMAYFMHKDYERTRSMTVEANGVFLMWVFIGIACCAGGFMMGYAEVFTQCYMAYLCLLCSFGCFMTGIIIRFRPKTICGIIGAVLSAVPLLFQGEQWPWQLLIAAAIMIITLIIPGHLFKHYVRHHGL